jgi:hypothetical protein
MSVKANRKFISVIAAVSIGVTSLIAAPARAGQYDTERAIAALLGLAVIGAIVADDRKDRRKRNDAVTRHSNQGVHDGLRNGHIRRTPTLEARPLPNRVSRKLLPQRCLRSFETDRGRARVFGARCMDRHYDFVRDLPARCERRIRTDRGVRYGYSARCLDRYGYQLARR